MNFIGSKTLETERLILRKTEEQDLIFLWKTLLIDNVKKFYLVCKINEDWEKEKIWQYKKLAKAGNPDVFVWSVVLKDTNEVIGQVSAQESDKELSIRDVGWFINPIYQRKGYAYEATSKMLDYMFNEVGIDSIETCAAIINPASWLLMEKLGFVRDENVKKIIHYPYAGDYEVYSYHLNSYDYKNENKKMKLK